MHNDDINFSFKFYRDLPLPSVWVHTDSWEYQKPNPKTNLLKN